jgi:hypothetical protein
MSKVLVDEAVLQQALEALRRGVPTGDITLVDWYRAISALKAAHGIKENT